MTRYIELVEHSGADIPARYYADGKRVSRGKFYHIKDCAVRLECFSTKGKQLDGGRIRRINYSTAVVAG